MNNSLNSQTQTLWKTKRFYLVLLLFTSLVINYIDRVNLSVAAPLIAQDLQVDPGMMGLLFSSFLWTYVIFLVPAGWAVDKFGSHRVLSFAILFWSVAAMLTGATYNFASMLAARLGLGVGEAASYPTGGKVIRQWFPAKERGFVTSLFNSGSYAGPGFVTPVVAWLVLETGWRLSFVILGALGLIWLLFWVKYYRDNPEECTWLPQKEREYILANTDTGQTSTAPENAQSKGAIGRLLRRKTMWGMMITQGAACYAQYLFLTWLPSYLVQARGMQLMKASIFASLPFVCAVVLGIYFGKISDQILTPENVKQGKRRTMVVTFMLLSSVVLFTTKVDNEYVILALLSLSLTCIASSLSLNCALINDLVPTPAIAGSAFSMLVLGGNIFGMCAPIATGYIVKATGSFNSAFYLAGALLILGAMTSLTMTRKPLTVEEKS